MLKLLEAQFQSVKSYMGIEMTEFASAVIVAALLIGIPTVAVAEEWVLRKETSSAICHVQKSTASPLGEDYHGPFPNRKAACEDAKVSYDDSSTDKSKCIGYGRGTIDGCKVDGVSLPK
jgi:hypothetical protein